MEFLFSGAKKKKKKRRKKKKEKEEILDAHLINLVWHGLEIDGRGRDLLLGSLIAVSEAEKDRTGKIK